MKKIARFGAAGTLACARVVIGRTATNHPRWNLRSLRCAPHAFVFQRAFCCAALRTAPGGCAARGESNRGGTSTTTSLRRARAACDARKEGGDSNMAASGGMAKKAGERQGNRQSSGEGGRGVAYDRASCACIRQKYYGICDLSNEK